MSCGVGQRHGSDPALLLLWRRPAATAPIRPLAWEPPYAARQALEKAKKKKKKIELKKHQITLHCAVTMQIPSSFLASLPASVLLDICQFDMRS